MAEKFPTDFRNAIAASGKDIYSPIEIGDPDYWIPTPSLEWLLNEGLPGNSLAGLPLRTRSKVVKELVCRALGYPIPKSFKKTKPRFVGQNFDTYVQKSRNLQIWNEELSPSRRYVLIQVTSEDIIGCVRVVNGQELALLDTTGTITTKYQARLDVGEQANELISPQDTDSLLPHVSQCLVFDPLTNPAQEPKSGLLRPIREIFELLVPLVGFNFPDLGKDQERNRGAVLHRAVCQRLGYTTFRDSGQFPDVRHQLLEVKLQTSPTIDLGLVLPNSEEYLDIGRIGELRPRHRDTRYAIFRATTNGEMVTLTHVFVSTGAEFFRRFKQFGGREINGKLQIPLPVDFFTM